jgi:ribosome biogenesis protein Nip4
MAIIYREPTETETKMIQSALVYWIEKSKLQIIEKNHHFIIGEGNWREVFITNSSVSSIIKEKSVITPYSVGLGIGELKKDEFLLSLSGGYFIFNYSDKKATISPEAEQLFLYRRDIHCKSITKISEKLSQEDKVLIGNSSNDYLGLGKIVLPISEFKKPQNENEVAIKNIIDLGWYLRKGK